MLEPRSISRFALGVIFVYAILTWCYPGLEHVYARWFRAFGNTTFQQFWVWSSAGVSFVDLRSDDVLAEVNKTLPAALPEGFKLPERNRDRETLLVIKNRNTPANVGFSRTSSRVMGYAPTSIIIALAIATPALLRNWKKEEDDEVDPDARICPSKTCGHANDRARRECETCGTPLRGPKAWLVAATPTPEQFAKNMKTRVVVLIVSLLLVHLFIMVRISALVLNQALADPSKSYALFRPGNFMRDLIGRADTILADNPTFAYVAPVFVWLLSLLLIEGTRTGLDRLKALLGFKSAKQR